MVILDSEFEKSMEGADPFEFLQAIQGKIYREAPGRRTFQCNLNSKSYFVKFHSGVGWFEIVKNLFQLRLPILGAVNEWRAIHKLQELNIDTMTPVAFGERGWNPAARQSFVVTEELVNTDSLEDFCKNWLHQKPDFVTKRLLIEKVAAIARALHNNGVCHRDFYLCHFLQHKELGVTDVKANLPKLSLIDLHRVLIKPNLGLRWIVKDIGGLYYSALNIGLTKRDLLRFIKHYDHAELRYSLGVRRKFWQAVNKRTMAMTARLRGQE